LTLTLAGCVATGNKFVREIPANEAEALIYVYRPAGFIGSAQRPDLKIDGVLVGSVASGGFLVKKIPLGRHELRLTGEGNPFKWNFPDRSVVVDIKNSGNYYFRYSPTSRSGMASVGITSIAHSYTFESVSETVALQALGGLNRAE
jgi:hypothetical protein